MRLVQNQITSTIKAVAVAGAATVDVALDLAGAATFDVVLELAGAATFDVALDVAGAATLDVALDLAGAATFDVAVDFEVALDLLRHWRCQVFQLSVGNCWKTCLSRRRVGLSTRLAAEMLGNPKGSASCGRLLFGYFFLAGGAEPSKKK